MRESPLISNPPTSRPTGVTKPVAMSPQAPDHFPKWAKADLWLPKPKPPSAVTLATVPPADPRSPLGEDDAWRDLPVRFSIEIDLETAHAFHQGMRYHQGNETWFWNHAIPAWLQTEAARHPPARTVLEPVFLRRKTQAVVTLKAKPPVRYMPELWGYSRKYHLRFEDMLLLILVQHLDALGSLLDTQKPTRTCSREVPA